MILQDTISLRRQALYVCDGPCIGFTNFDTKIRGF